MTSLKDVRYRGMHGPVFLALFSSSFADDERKLRRAVKNGVRKMDGTSLRPFERYEMGFCGRGGEESGRGRGLGN